jgi:hypothetical protein
MMGRFVRSVAAGQPRMRRLRHVARGLADPKGTERSLSTHCESIAYFGILLVGFALWVVYGVASDTVALVVPNTVAFLTALATVVVAFRYR